MAFLRSEKGVYIWLLAEGDMQVDCALSDWSRENFEIKWKCHIRALVPHSVVCHDAICFRYVVAVRASSPNFSLFWPSQNS
jgi:hypothetical protein